MHRISVKSVFARLCRCGKAVLFSILRVLGLILWGILMGAAEILGVIVRGLAFLADGVVAWVRARRMNAARAVRAYRKPAKSRAVSVLRMLREMLLGRQGMLLSFLRFAVPVTCCLVLWSVVHQFQTRQYGIAVAVDYVRGVKMV